MIKKTKEEYVEAYKDQNFLESNEGRSIRILSEYEKVKSLFESHKIIDTITFFGSTRFIEKKSTLQKLRFAKKNNKEIKNAEIDLENANYYESARILAYKLTKWNKKYSKKHHRFVIATGGGPGIMEAANRGAYEGKGKSIGLGIKLPSKQKFNKYITPNLSIEFHYFFMRKFFLTYPAKATVIFPGGFGTLDEFMEVLTLKQTGKINKPMPIILFGKKYWKSVINFDFLIEKKVIDKKDVSLFLMTDYVEQAFEFITCILKEKCVDDLEIRI
jgi:uncharacterized protein (TIGR00730 family)